MWFVANAAGLTMLALFALRDLDPSPFAYAWLFTVAGAALATTMARPASKQKERDRKPAKAREAGVSG